MAEVFNAEFNPILLPKQTATLYGPDFDSGGQPVSCVTVGALPEYVKDFGALTAATWSNDNEDTNLKMPSNQLSQLRMRVLDDFKVRLKHPAAVSQWRTLGTQFELRRFPDDEMEVLKNFLFRGSEFFVWEDDNTPRFDLYSASTLTAARIWFGGWRFTLRKITKEQLTSPAEIWVCSWPNS